MVILYRQEGENTFVSLFTLGEGMDTMLKFNSRMLNESALASITSSSVAMDMDETAEILEVIQRFVCVPRDLSIIDVFMWWATAEPADA